ncbi:MAG TPA: TIGR02300 family protein [Pseudolabrys sp.]|nr:TIGR02300 family protein [Pseudolabrys sp.]
MAKPDLGTKRVCPDTGRKFYDLNKNPVISPYTGKVVPIVVAPTRAKPEQPARPVPGEEVEVAAPETAEVELVSLEDAEAEQQGKKPAAAGEPAAAEAGAEEEVEIDESLDDAAFIEEEEEGDADVSDIIGEGVEKEEET